MTKKKINTELFDFPEDITPETEWRGMPEFNQQDRQAHRQVIVSFEDDQAVKQFFELINQHYTAKTKSVWFPERAKNKLADLFYIGDK